jgi:hypothetical protein
VTKKVEKTHQKTKQDQTNSLAVLNQIVNEDHRQHILATKHIQKVSLPIKTLQLCLLGPSEVFGMEEIA